MFPTAKNAQESFQSARVMVSQAGAHSVFGLLRPETEPKKQQESREVSDLCHQAPPSLMRVTKRSCGHHYCQFPMMQQEEGAGHEDG